MNPTSKTSLAVIIHSTMQLLSISGERLLDDGQDQALKGDILAIHLVLYNPDGSSLEVLYRNRFEDVFILIVV